MGPANGTPYDQLRDACCHLANMIKVIDKSRAMSPFAKLRWPLFTTLGVLHDCASPRVQLEVKNRGRGIDIGIGLRLGLGLGLDLEARYLCST